MAGSGVDFTSRDREKTRFEIAEKLKKKLRGHIVSDFDTPGSLRLVQGESWVEVDEFQRWGSNLRADPEHTLGQRTAMVHAQTVTKEGRRVDLCLFGRLKNLRGYAVPEEDPGSGWVSSAAPAIEELIAPRGADLSAFTSPAFPYDDEGLAVEALKVALSQGTYLPPTEHRGRPETRAFTVMGFEASEYVALIYRDVTLTPGRWDHDPAMSGVSRILVGAPLWLRMTRPETMRTYYGANRVRLSSWGTSDTPVIAPTVQPPAITPVVRRPTRCVLAAEPRTSSWSWARGGLSERFRAAWALTLLPAVGVWAFREGRTIRFEPRSGSACC